MTNVSEGIFAAALMGVDLLLDPPAAMRIRQRDTLRFQDAAGHTLIVTADKVGPDSEVERELLDAHVVISQPFWPA